MKSTLESNESKNSSITLTKDWMDRLFDLAKINRQPGAAAQVRIWIEDEEKRLKVKPRGNKN